MANVWVLAGIGVAGLLSFLKLRKKRKDTGGFIEEFEIVPPPPPPAPFAPPPLTGLTFGVKEIFDITGLVTGFGNPDWARTHDAAVRTAPVVLALVESGATCKGRTYMDELAYSINGENKHYGTPRNPAAPSYVPGGSSSGSAVAVASGKVDFAVGTDTCGSVRLPAAYCGILGLRPSHGVVSTEGVIPMSPSLDTVGWFARDARLLQLVGQVMLQQQIQGERYPQSVYIANDVFDLSMIPKKQVLDAVRTASSSSPRRVSIQEISLGSRLAKSIPSLVPFLPSSPASDSQSASVVTLTALRDAMRALQSHEFKLCHQEWLESTSPDLANDIKDRVTMALASSPEKAALALKVRGEFRAAMSELLKGDCVLVIPTAPGLPPKLKTKSQELDDFRSRAFVILAVAGLSGCPQVTLPAGNVNGVPVAVSLVARHGGDAFLLQVARAWSSLIAEAAQAKPKAEAAAKKQSPSEIAKEKGNKAFREGGESKDAGVQNAKFKEAVDHYTQAIKLDSKNATLYNNRAMAHLKLCNFDKAENDCNKALEYDPKNVKALLRRGTAREFLGVYDEALEDFEHALVLEPTNKMAQDSRRRLRSMLAGRMPCEEHQFGMG